jgi:taurine dioxygenase
MNDVQGRPYRRIEASRLAGSLGAEITGVDLSAALSDEVMTEVRQALLDHLVIFFREQTLTPDQQVAFARRWGDIHYFPLSPGLPGHPEILEIRKTPEEEKNVGNQWHTDQMFAPKPAMATMLYAKQVPAYGGDTMFSNQYAAYDALSDAMKHMLEGLKTVCSVLDVARNGGGNYNADAPVNNKTVSAHPLLRTHPETGRRALYIGNHARSFEGMTEAESKPLLDYLIAHSTRPETTCRFRWRERSLAIWDNRCTQHFAINDYPAETRIMHRVTICGDVPF